ncbi:hypothetical protein T12_9121 [Trichinella patagoniensis]|uniref:Uncharacterized protein n=1 Tax=Trichinella patagoniensis TaxID=990121 RepID=A0A0V0Z348_9BILA|nr:hypothetical protein T12_9121 [Trichinella patagoniensis]
MTNDMEDSLLRASQRRLEKTMRTLTENMIYEWSFGRLEKIVYRLPNNTVYYVVCKNLLEEVIIKGTINLAVLRYLLLNKIAPLVSPRSDKSMEEAIDTTDKKCNAEKEYTVSI